MKRWCKIQDECVLPKGPVRSSLEKEALPVGVWRKGPSMIRGWGEGVPDAIGT